VVSVVDLGIVQSVAVEGDEVDIAITPTFTGCPALETMRAGIAAAARSAGATTVRVTVQLDPPWTSDRISPAARAAMAKLGIAPAAPVGSPFAADPGLALSPAPPHCPWCGSRDTVMDSPFGPTICRSVHYCRACRQSFEQFKSLGGVLSS
jgi:ring-1,2-phenylacetyl-CoA epoxidase subunit PaaD